MALQDDINNFGTSNTAADLIVLAAQTANTTNNRIISVATVNDLPNLANNTISPGTIFFVDSIQVPVVAQIGCWTGLDNRQLRNDFFVNLAMSWGRNNAGQLGINSTTNRCSPVSVVGCFIDWCQVSAGSGQSLGIRTNGTLWAWGINNFGKLGDGTQISRSSPVSVLGGFTDWCQVSGGGEHSAAVRANGTAWTWGRERFGRLGTGTGDISSPASVVGGFTDWCQIAASGGHTIAIRSNGTAWGWGCGCNGEIGNGCSGLGNEKGSPELVVGGFTDWCQIAASGAHTIAIRSNGTAWGWGVNSSGQLGNNNTTGTCSPVSVVGGFTDWCQVSAGSAHNLGVRTNGTIWAWGNGGNGRLGDNTGTNRSSPVSVVGGFTDWIKVSAGGLHSLGLRSNGTAWAWGRNNYGELGDCTITARTSPILVSGDLTDWCQVSAGSEHSLGIRRF